MNKEPGFFGVSRLPPAGVAGLILSGTTCRRQAVHTCTSQAVLTQPPRQQPLRPGPHDVDPGQPRQQPWFDILDVQVYVGIFLYELLERAISRHSFPLPGAELCFILLVAELCALLVHVRWHRPLASGRHKPRPPSWACVLLGFSTMLHQQQPPPAAGHTLVLSDWASRHSPRWSYGSLGNSRLESSLPPLCKDMPSARHCPAVAWILHRSTLMARLSSIGRPGRRSRTRSPSRPLTCLSLTTNRR